MRQSGVRGMRLDRKILFREKISRLNEQRWSNFDFKRKMSIIRGGTGIPYENCEYPVEFNDTLKEKIRKRDNYICQNCGMDNSQHIVKFGCNLSIHHIDYNKFNNCLTNLITLCYSCNSKANFNKNYWTNYFMFKLNRSLIYAT